jgi:hypothetical protein
MRPDTAVRAEPRNRPRILALVWFVKAVAGRIRNHSRGNLHATRICIHQMQHAIQANNVKTGDYVAYYRLVRGGGMDWACGMVLGYAGFVVHPACGNACLRGILLSGVYNIRKVCIARS